MIGRLVNEQLSTMKPKELWGNVLPLLHKNDLTIMNLEAALTLHPIKVPKVFNFKSDPEHVQCLKEANCEVVNIANNHIFDYAEQGLFDTLDTLDQAGIRHVGAGRTIQEAKKPVIIEIDGIRIGILGYTDNEPNWLATDQNPGTNYFPINSDSVDKLSHEIRELKREVDLVILSIHWGPNMVESPPKHFIDFAHQAVNAGVDIFHGHSAHIFQGVEIYKGSVILYDTGDFVDDYYVDPHLRNDRSFLFCVTVDKTAIRSIELVPVLIENFQVNLSSGSNLRETLERMVLLSSEFDTVFQTGNDTLHIEL